MSRSPPPASRMLAGALLWLVVVGACGALLNQLASVDARIAVEKELRDEVRESMQGYPLRDPMRWRADQRLVDDRIAALEHRRRMVLGLDLVLAALALSPLALVFQRPRARRRGNG
jgi:hypothetical protein